MTDSLVIDDLNGWNLYEVLNFIQKAIILEDLYELIGQSEKFANIRVKNKQTDLEQNLMVVIKDLITQLSEWQQSDGGFGYLKECPQYRYSSGCSSFDLTGQFLAVATYLQDSSYVFDQEITNNALEYYQKEFRNSIKNIETPEQTYIDIAVLYILKDYSQELIEKELIAKKDILEKQELSNLDQVKLLAILKELGGHDVWVRELELSLKNATFIEARGTVLPSGSNYWRSNDKLSTALFVKALVQE